MCRYVKDVFKGIVEDLDWMDEKTKQRAFRKMEKMNFFIGYPDEILDKGTAQYFMKTN